MNPIDPAHAFPDATDEPTTGPELGGALEPGPELATPDPDGADEAGGAEDAPAELPTVGGVLVPEPPELPPAQPVTVMVKQAMAAIPLSKWVWRMRVTTLHSMGCWAAGLPAIVPPRPAYVKNFTPVIHL